jgi:pimeloyl-ACP methyl ester carboxylesterase
MALPGLVLVHGGAHAGDCWDLTVAEIKRLTPELTVLAVDLPGRGAKPGDLRSAALSDWVNSIVTDIDDAGIDEVVVVGHSMAGLVVPGVAAKLGASRVREMVFATAFVPPDGGTLVDTLHGPGGVLARWGAKRGAPGTINPIAARLMFFNGLSRSRRQYMSSRLHAESSRILLERVCRRDMPDDVPRTWIMTLRDRALSVKSQRRSIAALGGVQTLIELDTCHDLMVSEPERLAQILIERCALYR